MRPLLLVCSSTLSVLLSGCGSVCDSAVAAENNSNRRGAECGQNNIAVHDANRCNQNLSKCSPDDMKEIQAYADCLDALPACTSSNSVSWGFSRAGCVLQPIGRISGTCAGAAL